MRKNKFGLSNQSLNSILSILLKHPQIKDVKIYGSRAIGNFREGSDIDIVLVGEELTTTDLLKIENELDDLLLPYKIDLSLFHQIENQDLVKHIQQFSISIY
jgi:predicted nucleotidyltransferase